MKRLLLLLLALPIVALYTFVSVAIPFFGLKREPVHDEPPLVVTGQGKYRREWWA